MSSIIFLLIFALCVVVALFLILRKQISIFLYPDDYVYILMEHNDYIDLWIEKRKNRESFKYNEGTYFFEIPQYKGENEIQEIKDTAV